MEAITATKPKTRCPNGTKKNKKTGNCDPVKQPTVKQPTVKQNTVKTVFGTRTNKLTGKKERVKLIIEDESPNKTPPQALAVPPALLATPAQALAVPPALLATQAPVAGQPEQGEDKLNALKNKMELQEREEFIEANVVGPNALPYLYPNLNDPRFNINLAARKEFHDTQYDGEIKPVEAEADLLCNAEFELAPHQLFVRNFLSFQTPYNSLLLYHGLGSGKTCSAISIAEEMRDYLIQMNISNRIIIVASPNVQENFKLQLFDENKLKLVDGIWNIRSCTGNKFLKEINPMHMKGLTRETIIAQVKRIINAYYVFLGYTEFANYIQKKSTISDDITDPKRRTALIRSKLKQQFSNRLIIIDEVHNIRISDDNADKKRVAQELFKLVKYAENMRLLLLSATPMYNSYKEIIWLVNLMNLNDRRSTIEIKDVFNADGTFKTSASGEPIGKDLLVRKATGYISYVRGENPYTFPYKLWPAEFAPTHTFATQELPLVQLNGKPLVQNIAFLSLYLIAVGTYQEQGYQYVLNNLKQKQDFKKGTAFENLEAFGYTMLQKPLEALNMVYPDARLLGASAEASAQASAEASTEASTEANTEVNIDVADLVGSGGLKRLMTYVETASPPAKYDFEYKTSQYGRIFAANEIGKYSSKIHDICEHILHSTGVILVYSQYIDGGILPVALALEERGFTRAGLVKSLFKTPPTEKIDALTLKTKKELEREKEKEKEKNPTQTQTQTQKFSPAKYVMITGDKGLSPDNVQDIKMLTDLKNKDGEQVKVVLISLAGSEGLDLKFIRQVHILDPWYNMNRIEQIIGRAVRTCSHKDLPFKKRNVEIYLYGTLLQNKREEAVDLYVYRLAELKAIQIGHVSRTIKEIAVDCILNSQQGNFSVENMDQTVQLDLASGGTLAYAIGDKPYSAICDYMEKCNYTCKPSINSSNINTDTYGEAFIMQSNDKIIYKIKQLFKERFFYRKTLLVVMLNAVKTYPLMQINAALTQLIEDKNEYLTDKYGRLGNLVNIGDLYLFQPLELTNVHVGVLDRSMPIEYKHDKISIDLSKLVEAVNLSAQVKPKELVKPSKSNIVKPPAPEVLGPGPATGPGPANVLMSALGPVSGPVLVPEPATALGPVSGPATALGPVPAPAIAPIPVSKALPVLEQMRANYQLAFTPHKPKRGEDNWYKFCGEVIDEMEQLSFGREVLLDALVAHICDELNFDDKLLLLQHFAHPADKSDEFLNRVERYLLKDRLINKGITGLLVQNKSENKLYIQGPAKTWTVAEAEDKHDLEGPLMTLRNTFLPVKQKLHNIIGFMANFKKEENNIVFKLKVFTLKGVVKKRNKGARCYGKSIEMMEEIMGLEMLGLYLDVIKRKYKDIIEEKKKNRLLNNTDDGPPDDLEAINHIHACVIQEMFLRVYNLQQKNGRQWFLTPEEAVLIDVENTTF